MYLLYLYIDMKLEQNTIKAISFLFNIQFLRFKIKILSSPNF